MFWSYLIVSYPTRCEQGLMIRAVPQQRRTIFVCFYPPFSYPRRVLFPFFNLKTPSIVWFDLAARNFIHLSHISETNILVYIYLPNVSSPRCSYRQKSVLFGNSFRWNFIFISVSYPGRNFRVQFLISQHRQRTFFRIPHGNKAFFLLFFFLDCPCIVYFYLLSHLIAFFWCFFGKLF